MKKTTSNYETTQLLNVQIESVDRKMRSIAIKRSENMQVNIEPFIKIQKTMRSNIVPCALYSNLNLESEIPYKYRFKINNYRIIVLPVEP